ncbi:hypothetical protein GW17_00017602 [Ensete ventricosum]|nr:hypothetical protein GW17_00017602 [Ensete ventricosum]
MRTGGARLVFWFARRSVRSKFIEDAPIPSVRSTFPFVSWSCCYVTRFRRSHLFVASLQMEDSSRLLASGKCCSSRSFTNGRSEAGEPGFCGIGDDGKPKFLPSYTDVLFSLALSHFVMDRNTITVSEGFLRCPWCEQGRKCFRYQESLLCGRKNGKYTNTVHTFMSLFLCPYSMKHFQFLDSVKSIGILSMQLAKKLHPDTNKDDADAEKKFQEVQRAYEVK